MIEDEHLKYFIQEEVFVLEEKTPTIAREATPTPPEQTIPPVTTTEKKVTHEVGVWTEKLNPEDQALLQKMLAAVKIDFADICLMEGAGLYLDNCRKLLCFGFGEALKTQSGLEFQTYEVTSYSDKKVLTAPPLRTFHNNDAEKRKLWEGLKNLFPA